MCAHIHTGHIYTYTYTFTHALFVIQESGDNFSAESWLKIKTEKALTHILDLFFLKNREKEIIYNSFVTYYTYMCEWESIHEKMRERERERKNCWRPIRRGRGKRTLESLTRARGTIFHGMLAMPDTKQLTSSIFPDDRFIMIINKTGVSLYRIYIYNGLQDFFFFFPFFCGKNLSSRDF